MDLTGIMFAAAVAGAASGLVVLAALARASASASGPARWRMRLQQVDARRLGIAAAVGAVVLVLTRWPVAAVGSALIIVLWPNVFGGAAAARREIERTEALAVWTESMRDTSVGAIGLEQAIPVTSENPPPALQQPLRKLCNRLTARIPLPEALARFADDVNSATADLVVAALILNARVRGEGLAAILGSLADSIRTELETLRRTEEERRQLRRQNRIIVAAILAFVGMQAVFAQQYVTPYSTPVGQLVLAFILVIFVGAFVRMRKLAEPDAPARFLTAAEDVTAIATRRAGGV